MFSAFAFAFAFALAMICQIGLTEGYPLQKLGRPMFAMNGVTRARTPVRGKGLPLTLKCANKNPNDDKQDSEDDEEKKIEDDPAWESALASLRSRITSSSLSTSSPTSHILYKTVTSSPSAKASVEEFCDSADTRIVEAMLEGVKGLLGFMPGTELKVKFKGDQVHA